MGHRAAAGPRRRVDVDQHHHRRDQRAAAPPRPGVMLGVPGRGGLVVYLKPEAPGVEASRWDRTYLLARSLARLSAMILSIVSRSRATEAMERVFCTRARNGRASSNCCASKWR